MRNTTIIIGGAVLAILVGVVGFRLAQEGSKPSQIGGNDRGYLEAIEPPTEVAAADRIDASDDREPEPATSAPPRSEPVSRPATNRWARLREADSAHGTGTRVAKSEETSASPSEQEEQGTATEPAAAITDAQQTKSEREAPPQADSRPEPETTPGPQAETKPEAKPAPEPDPEPDTRSEPESEPEPEPTATQAARTYKIRAGDTLASIAIMHYADASKWRLIARANPTVNPRQLRIGQTVTLPPADQQEASGEDAPGNRVLAAHVVKEGDSLYSLAKRYYGDGTRWPAIREANPGLKGASLHQLKLGSKLIIPAHGDDDAAE